MSALPPSRQSSSAHPLDGAVLCGDCHDRLEMCECGHPLADHAESGWGPHTVCVEKLPTFPEGGWYGVCPCVRTDDWEGS